MRIVEKIRKALDPSVQVDPEDEELLASRRWRVKDNGYLIAGGGYRVVYFHRLVMDPAPGFQVDHINGDKLDNRRANLRVVTPRENSQNITKVNAASGYRGVYAVKGGGWFARAKKDGQRVYLGYFKVKEEAAAVARSWRLANFPGALS